MEMDALSASEDGEGGKVKAEEMLFNFLSGIKMKQKMNQQTFNRRSLYY